MVSQKAAVSMTSAASLRMPTAHEELRASSQRLQNIVTKELQGNVERGKKILTDTAKGVIRIFLQSSKQAARVEGNPHDMLPSPDEGDYSYWCSFCCDRNTDILLCAGCRVGTCVQDPDDLHMGCLEPAPEFRKEDFVFYCFLCCKDKGQHFEFTRATHKPSLTKASLLFRYDPAVVFVELNLPTSSSRIPETILITLQEWYKGNSDAILHIPLKLGRMPKARRKNKKVAPFLEKNPLAKIVIVIDTHSGQDGKLITDDVGGWIHSDDLGPILLGYLPAELAEILDSKSKAEHKHRTLILNMSCGASVIDTRARKSLLAGHCGELVVSFGVDAVIPAKISGPLGEFVHHWVGTLQPLVEIVHQTMTSAYISSNIPVFSSREFGHFTVATSDNFTIVGHVVRCVNRCPSTLSASSKSLGRSQTRKKWRIQCNGCKYVASYIFPDVQKQVAQEEASKVKKIGSLGYWTPYPVKTLVLNWRPKEPADETENQAQRRSQSLSRSGNPWTGGTTLTFDSPVVSRVRSEGGLNTAFAKRRRDSSPPAQDPSHEEHGAGSSGSMQRKRSRNRFGNRP